MKLYYSGASNYEEEQSKSNLSLGNYISSIEVPNGYLGATISSVSRLIQSRNSKQVFMLILKNTSGVNATDVTVYYDYPSSGKYKLELAFVAPSVDSENDPIFEKIANPSSLPLTGTFSEYSGVGNSVNIGDVDNGLTVGIWFKLTLVSANNAPLTDQQLYDAFVANENLETEEEITFNISYT